MWLSSLHEDLATRDYYNRLAMGSEWFKRQGPSHLFGIDAITRSSFLGIEVNEILSTWDLDKVMKHIQLLDAHEQVGLTDVPLAEGISGPVLPPVGPDESSQPRTAFIISSADWHGRRGPSRQLRRAGRKAHDRHGATCRAAHPHHHHVVS